VEFSSLAGFETMADPALPSLTFLYHELRPERSAYSYVLGCEAFEEQVDLFCRVRESGGVLWPRISFDDGHVSNYEYALPILESRGVVARFFLTVGWMGQRAGYLDWGQVRSLHDAGQRIGAHGWTHTLLTHCGALELERELGGARKALEDRLGSAITSMSLPGGRYNRRVLAACRAAGYREIFTSIPRAEMSGAELVGRVNVRAGMSVAALEQLLRPGGAALAKMGRAHHLKEGAKALLGDRLYAKVWALANRQEPDLIAAP
jgi:peptidoglycan/xylan/chitin deacetylase (PgdA/CDA1 family)